LSVALVKRLSVSLSLDGKPNNYSRKSKRIRLRMMYILDNQVILFVEKRFQKRCLLYRNLIIIVMLGWCLRRSICSLLNLTLLI